MKKILIIEKYELDSIAISMAKIFNQNQLQSIDLNQVPRIKNSLKKILIIEKCGFDFGHHLNDQDFRLQLVTIWQPKSNPESKRKKKLKKI